MQDPYGQQEQHLPPPISPQSHRWVAHEQSFQGPLQWSPQAQPRTHLIHLPAHHPPDQKVYGHVGQLEARVHSMTIGTRHIAYPDMPRQASGNAEDSYTRGPESIVPGVIGPTQALGHPTGPAFPSYQAPVGGPQRVASIRRPLPPTPGRGSPSPYAHGGMATVRCQSSTPLSPSATLSSFPNPLSSSSTGSTRQSSYDLSEFPENHGYRGDFIVSDSYHEDAASRISFSGDGQGANTEISLLSHLAFGVRRSVHREQHHRGHVVQYGFTGRGLVDALEALMKPSGRLEPAMNDFVGETPPSRALALQIARSLQAQLWVHSVGWDASELCDDPDEIYNFLNEEEQVSSGDNGVYSEIMDIESIPSSVITPLTLCYSPLCAQDGGNQPYACYSPQCPRARSIALRSAELGITDTNVSGMLGPTGDASWVQADRVGKQKLAWAEIVPPSVLNSLTKAEISRQNEIHEAIQKEEEFYEDLSLLDTLFLPGLQWPNAQGDPPPLPLGEERDAFIAEVFSNYRPLIDQVRTFLERLHQRQREESPVIQTIGDIFLDAALDWGDAFIRYIVNYPLAIARVRRELVINPKFRAFVETARRDPRCHRLTLDHFLYRPSPRLQRYRLHLQEIHKHTDESNYDRDTIVQAMDVINDQLQTCNAGMVAAEQKAKIREYAFTFTTLRSKGAPELDLLNPERQLVYEGRVYRKPDGFDFEWQDCLAILFDHYLLIAKTKKGDEGDGASLSSHRLALARRPLALEMLELVSFDDPPISRSVGLGTFNLRNADRTDTREAFPFTLRHIASSELFTLFVASAAIRETWQSKLEHARRSRLSVRELNRPFELQPLSAEIFALPPVHYGDLERPPPGADPSLFHGRVTCAVPFATADGRRLIAIGCADGVWIGLRHDPRSLRKVLHLKLVTQCAVLESFGIFVVLADKVLISYSLEALVPSADVAGAPPRPPQRLSGNRDVLFFNVGLLKERTLLIYMKKKASESVFRALEPVVNTTRNQDGRGGSGFFGKFGKDSKSSDWFRVYKTFFIPSDAFNLQYLRSKLCVICAKGFEIMNLDSLLPGTIPDFSQCPRDDAQVQMLMKRIETSKALGMFKISESEFLLCYDSFACYVDRLGSPVRLASAFTWEGHIRSVAYSAPWVIAFDSRFIEIRDGFTGILAQVLWGRDIRNVSGGTIQGPADGSSILVSERRQAGDATYDLQLVSELVRRASSYADYI